MTNLQLFQFESQEVRVIVIGDESWFLSKDIAVILGYSNPTKAIRQHCEQDETLTDTELRKKLKDLSQSQNGIVSRGVYVNISGVFSLIFGSQLPSAKAFRKWVTSEVLPAIAKTGSYSLNTELKQLPEWHGMRRSGVDVRKTLTEAVELYKEQHPEMSDNRRNFLQKNTADQLNLQRFGHIAKKLREERGLSKNQPLRDSMTIDELFDVKRIECLAVDLIIQHDFYPPDAIIEAMNRMLIPALKQVK